MSVFGIHENRIVELIDTFHPIRRVRKVDTRYCLHQVCKVLTTGMRWMDYHGLEVLGVAWHATSERLLTYHDSLDTGIEGSAALH